MSWISKPQLVAAVSNAGGVGILATGPLNPSETRDAIRQIRSLTDQPFGIGATLLMPGAAENAKVALEEQVPIINVSLGKAEWIAEGLAQYDGKLLATVTTVKHAQAALESGADAFMVTGQEAAAHGGDVTSLVLVPCMAEQFPDVPIVAAGGIANGRGLVAALSLGADAVAMGSRMAVTQESPLAQATKEAIVQASAFDTLYGSNFDGIPARVLKTPAAEQAMKSRPWLPVIVYRSLQAARQLDIPLWKVLPGLVTQFQKMFVVAQFGAATEAIMAATVDGDVDGKGVQFIGQCQGMIRDIPAVDVLVQRIIQEAIDITQNQRTIFPDDEDGGSWNGNYEQASVCSQFDGANNTHHQSFGSSKSGVAANASFVSVPGAGTRRVGQFARMSTSTTRTPLLSAQGRQIRVPPVSSRLGDRSFHQTIPSFSSEADAVPQTNEEGYFDPNEITYAFAPPSELSDESKRKVNDLFDKIVWLDMIEVHLLTQMVNEKLGISWKETELGTSSTAGVAKAGASADGAGDEQKAEAKTIFDLKLVGYDAKAKIKVIKEIRTIAGLGLKEAKDLVEAAPKIFQKQVKQDKAEELKAQLEAVGAEVELV